MTEIEAEALRNRVEELQALLGVGNDDVSRLLTVLDATPQQCEMVGFMLRRSVATRTGASYRAVRRSAGLRSTGNKVD